MRRAAGRALVVSGGALLLWAGSAWGRSALARDAARSEWWALEARRIAEGGRALGARPIDLELRPGSPLLRLRIASIGLDEIVVEGVGDAELRAGPGHLPGTPLPGAAGNAVLSAHRDRHFRRLDEVAVGDTVFTDPGAGSDVQRWIVAERRVVDAEAPAIFRSDEPRLTLTTCWPVRYFGPAPERLLLTARPLDR